MHLILHDIEIKNYMNSTFWYVNTLEKKKRAGNDYSNQL